MILEKRLLHIAVLKSSKNWVYSKEYVVYQ